MSCGEHHDTDCSEVLAEVWLYLDGECDKERRAVLVQHLDECSPCLAEYGLDEKLKQLLARKCSGETAPETLKAKLRKQILQQAQVSVESGPGGTTVEVRTTRIERSL
ncbi:mycothiol system anti-sigma-R factor [Pseudonocardia sp. WMMC193]|uniref:mycothiol system anti-sigma-R factor n=1 Tax=Pseudonocardia sp. WMMC193 TaxID=2911965 RepID=UPI001F030C2E|nr:mycothiol system anti-sigma-R factor [Pseudonocardia sp. WMMC193]MCF7550505.1 mycothiol system anti-sigma-R factor [Pseudonocardia sp. WMMC193]